MKLIQLQYFEVICKHNSFTKASEELHVSQPTLSVAINDLEKEFGVTLFYRQRNGLRITEDGEKLLELSKTVTVPVPYPNMPKRQYPKSLPLEVYHAETL